MEGIAVGTAVTIGVEDEVGEGVMGVGEGVVGADAVALGVGFDGGITSTFLSIALVGMTRSRYVEAIST
jgi:hypothetical protein